MTITRSDTVRLFRFMVFAALASILVAFAIWRSLDYAKGPVISIVEPGNGSILNASTTTVKGQALRVNNLHLNGNPLSMDEEGNWSSDLVIFPGLNLITVTAEDRFGRTASRQLDLIGSPIQ